jgi:oligoendopeptidase F
LNIKKGVHKMENIRKIPERSDIKENDKWDLSRLFSNDAEWEKGLVEFTTMVEKIASFRGTLSSSAEKLEECLLYMNKLGLLEEKLGYYSNLKLSEDGGDGLNQERFSKFITAATKAQAESSFMNPELQAIPDDKMDKLLSDEKIKPFLIMLSKILRYKPHILSDSEEKLLAMQSEANQTARKAFSSLTDVDMDFGTVKTEEGELPLSQSSYSAFMINPDRDIRKKAYLQFLDGYDKHKNTIATLYAGSVHLDLYSSRVRKFTSCREESLFADKVDKEVYDNLIKTVHENLPSLHRYYEIRRKALSVDKLRLYDVYVPIIKDIKVHHSYEEAVETIVKALSPLGEEYCRTLSSGLLNGWVDNLKLK